MTVESGLFISEGSTFKNKYYAARHKDKNVRWASRSGGAFTAISDIVLESGGVVYGAACLEDFTVRHIRADSKQLRDKMRGSKYVQSRVDLCLQDVISDLVSGRKVLFTGTSCQVDAVKKMCQGHVKYNNLICMDFVCHGVPSPKVWSDYLSMYHKIVKVDFRNKVKFGWEDHIETIFTECKTYHSNIFTKLYHRGYIVRPVCHCCPYAQYQRFSDITIGDCWGVNKSVPGFNKDDSGVSMIMTNSTVGEELVNEAIKSMCVYELEKNDIRQPVMEAKGLGTCRPHKDREAFWLEYKKHGIVWITKKYSTNNIIDKIKLKLRLPHFVRFGLKKILKKV